MMMIIMDAWLIAVANSLTSIFAGFVVFGTLGMLAQVIRILWALSGALYVKPWTTVGRSKTSLTFWHSARFYTITQILKIINQNNGVSVEDVITGGEGLTFQVIA